MKTFNITIITFITVINIITIIFPTPAFAKVSLNDINQKVCDRFGEDLNRLAAIMDEVKDRKGITETRVAFGGSDTPVKSADYWVNFAAEALAFQRVQEYSSRNELKYSLEILRDKVLKAKAEAGRAINSDE